MDKIEVQYVNERLQAWPGMEVVDKISDVEVNEIHMGRIAINTDKGRLDLNVKISSDFPLGKLEFFCTSHVGLEHEMPDGLLCLRAMPAKDMQSRLELELEKLNLWVEKYFINEEKDEHFEYYQFRDSLRIRMLFEEDSTKEKVKGTYGVFRYDLQQEYNVYDKMYSVFISNGIGGRKNRWSNFYREIYKWKNKGLWIFLNRHPLLQGRQTIENWSDLLCLMDAKQTQYLYDESKRIRSDSFFSEGVLVMIGYLLKSEVHWDMMCFPFNEFPYHPKKIKAGRYEPVDNGTAIKWCTTANVSYERLFGRGKLIDKLTGSKILIIGTGAIGSSLFMALVRGGCKEIEISDFDDVDPGNICRGHFSFRESFRPKIQALFKAASELSPYINIGLGIGIKAMRKANQGYKKEKDRLMQYDFIFDCSTDKYLSIMLDEMDLRSTIINFSISEKANHFVAITGNGNIHSVKSELYNKLVTEKAEPFFVATGCWQPTFQASHVDINVGLMYALNEINHKLEKGEQVRSFYISKTVNEMNSLTYDISYNV